MSATIIALATRAPLPDREGPVRQRLANPDQTAATELRRARIRIAQLESSLHEITRENVANFQRARIAERKLDALVD